MVEATARGGGAAAVDDAAGTVELTPPSQGHGEKRGVTSVDKAAGQGGGGTTVDEATGKAESVEKAAMTAEELLSSLRPRVEVKGPPSWKGS